jgi:hypothetical protein
LGELILGIHGGGLIERLRYLVCCPYDIRNTEIVQNTHIEPFSPILRTDEKVTFNAKVPTLFRFLKELTIQIIY